nr:hypothetical protein [Tanacetum cinerariifolium]
MIIISSPPISSISVGSERVEKARIQGTFRSGSVVEGLHPDLGGSAAQHTQLFGGCTRYVDQPAASVWTTVVDADHDLAIIVQVGDLHAGAERQLAMRGGQGVLVETFTAGGALALMLGAVIGGAACCVVAVWIDDAFTGATGQQRKQGASAEEPPHGS